MSVEEFEHVPEESINTAFEWRIYADATLAGLSELIPIPLVDYAFSRWFERRMITSIAQHRQINLSKESIATIRRGRGGGCGCLAWIWILPIELVKRLFRTIAYVLTVHAAAKALSENWQRAFLLDYSLQKGHLAQPEMAWSAAEAIEQTINANKADPFLQLAGEVIKQSKHTLRSMFRVTRKHQEDETVSAAKGRMMQNWDEIRGNLVDLAWEYDARWQTIEEFVV